MTGTGQRIGIDPAKVQRARLRLGFSLRDVAARSEELGKRIDPSQLSKYECGKRRPWPRTLAVLAKALEVEVDDLLAGPATPPK